ncbi:MAG: right-handed parallel beta-helix repeat-containing protein, partial [Luteolibacter sp.]|nr:right-handed parallel beta-helix repeat-containing protein [Luteolibacter sp.]
LDSFIQIKNGAKNIRLERLAFTGCNATAIQVINAENCLVAGCTLSTVGGYTPGNGAFGGAIQINGGSRNIITGCDISLTGGAGINASGGDRITLTDALHKITNNDIHHVGVFGKGSSGIDAFGCGILIAHNLIHDCPRIAVQMGGNRFIVEYNHLHHLCMETNDGGAVYTGGRDWLGGRGTIWRYNRIHDVIGCGQTANGLQRPAFVFGLYPDDNAGGMDMIGNLVYRVGTTPLHMHNSRDCLVENNIFAFGGSHLFDFQGLPRSEPRVDEFLGSMIKGYESVSRQPAWKRMRAMGLHPKNAFHDDGTMMSGNILRRNIMISNSDAVKYSRMSAATPKWNTIDGNLAWNGSHPVKTGTGDWAAWQAAGWDKNSIVADPLFGNPEADDFRLKAASPAITKLGFKPLPIEKMGLIRDQWRK